MRTGRCVRNLSRRRYRTVITLVFFDAVDDCANVSFDAGEHNLLPRIEEFRGLPHCRRQCNANRPSRDAEAHLIAVITRSPRLYVEPAGRCTYGRGVSGPLFATGERTLCTARRSASSMAWRMCSAQGATSPAPRLGGITMGAPAATMTRLNGSGISHAIPATPGHARAAAGHAHREKEQTNDTPGRRGYQGSGSPVSVTRGTGALTVTHGTMSIRCPGSGLSIAPTAVPEAECRHNQRRF
jgi:hypothetical protein